MRVRGAPACFTHPAAESLDTRWMASASDGGIGRSWVPRQTDATRIGWSCRRAPRAAELLSDSPPLELALQVERELDEAREQYRS